MTCCIAGITITHTDILLKCSMYKFTCGEHGLESLENTVILSNSESVEGI